MTEQDEQKQVFRIFKILQNLMCEQQLKTI